MLIFASDFLFYFLNFIYLCVCVRVSVCVCVSVRLVCMCTCVSFSGTRVTGGHKSSSVGASSHTWSSLRAEGSFLLSHFCSFSRFFQKACFYGVCPLNLSVEWIPYHQIVAKNSKESGLLWEGKVGLVSPSAATSPVPTIYVGTVSVVPSSGIPQLPVLSFLLPAPVRILYS